MLHSYTKIYIHLTWATKNRDKLIKKEVRATIQKHISEYATANQINLEELNVQMEHVHALINLTSDQKIESIVHLLKGESSHWINNKNIILQKFSWQRGYAAFSISPSHYDRVKLYIQNQDEHHRKLTFTEEYHTLLTNMVFCIQKPMNRFKQF
jgi:REP element-mobilizing transposase RayT